MDRLLQNKILILRVFFIFSFFILSYLFFQFTVDDSYITFRYSRNFFNLGIWNWNPDSNFVECYTSVSYAVLSLISFFFKIEPHIFFKFFGLVIGILIFKRIISLNLDYLKESSILIIFFLNPYFYFHLFSGLETPFFIYLIFEALIYIERKHFNVKIFYSILLLLPATRPEGAIISIFFLIFMFKKEKYFKDKNFLLYIISIGIIYFLIRYFYFGKLLPNTFYHKSVDGFSIFNLINIHTFNRSIIYLILIISAIPLLSKLRIKISYILTPFILIFAFYLSSRLSMNYAERFFIQLFLPLIAFLFINVKKNQIYFIFVISLLYSVSTIKNYEEILHLASYKPRLTSSYEALGKAFNKYKDQNVSIAMTDVGILPYYSDLYTHDIIGVCRDSDIDFNLNYLKKTQPKILVFLANGPLMTDVDQNYKWQKELLEYKNFITDRIIHAGNIKVSFNRYLAIYVDNKSPSYNLIVNDIKKIEENNNRKISIKEYLMLEYL